jgi:glycosyltransferase involved in cell wall biosynthesis
MSSTPSKRVLFIASQPFFEWRGSPIRLGFDVMALSQLGYEVDFLTLPLGQRREVPGVRIVRAPNLFFAKKIAIGPSLLKLAFDGVLLVMALGMALRRRYAVVHGVEDAGIVAWAASRVGRAGLVFEKHSDPSSYKKGRVRNFVMRLYTAVERFVIRRADAVIGTGPALVEQARAAGCGGRACHIPDIPSSLAEPTPEATAAARLRYTGGEDCTLCAYVGSFAVYQGIDLLFESICKAAAQEPRARFLIVGGTPDEIAARREQLSEAGVEHAVHFAGFIPPDELPDSLAAADVLLSPRIAGANTPLKLLDYLKAGGAIVATDCQANRLILDDQSALLVQPEPDEFAKAIVLLCRDEALRRRIASGGAGLLEEKYNFRAFKEGLRDCYRYVIGRRR